jgi:hypothetical protein
VKTVSVNVGQKMKKSGHDNYEGIWGNPYYDENAIPLCGLLFKQRLFTATPALVRVNPTFGVRERCEFKGQPFDILCDACHEHYRGQE